MSGGRQRATDALGCSLFVSFDRGRDGGAAGAKSQEAHHNADFAWETRSMQVLIGEKTGANWQLGRAGAGK